MPQSVVRLEADRSLGFSASEWRDSVGLNLVSIFVFLFVYVYYYYFSPPVNYAEVPSGYLCVLVYRF